MGSRQVRAASSEDHPIPVVSSLKVDSLPSRPEEENPFELFFRDPLYLEFKNHLYNYLRRREEIQSRLGKEEGMILEIGSGVSPIVPRGQKVIYSDTSEEAMRYMKEKEGANKVIAMSGTDIALKNESVSTVICSEVIEHIKEDGKALQEMTRVLKINGSLILTVPAHEYYFSYDDSFVKHERRYAIGPLLKRLGDLGLAHFELSKVAGLLEKITMFLAVWIFRVITRILHSKGDLSTARHPFLKTVLPIYKGANRLYSQLVKWEAKVMPLFLASIVLIHCRKSIPPKSL